VAVTEVGFGAAAIGNLYKPTDDATAAGAVHVAWDPGVRYFDTAPHYGLGLAEQRQGGALAAYPRAQYVVSTKVGRLLVRNPAPTGSDLPTGMLAVPDTLTRRLDYSRDGVRRSLEASLRRLGLDRIDVALVHDPDDFVDQTISEAIPALVELRELGVIGAVGVGMNQWQDELQVVPGQPASGSGAASWGSSGHCSRLALGVHPRRLRGTVDHVHGEAGPVSMIRGDRQPLLLPPSRANYPYLPAWWGINLTSTNHR
jgi:hypothetical protein